MSVYYVVQILRQWKSLTVLGVPLNVQRAAPGCIGFLPVFDTAEAAEEWKKEQHPNAGIAAITESAEL